MTYFGTRRGEAGAWGGWSARARPILRGLCVLALLGAVGCGYLYPPPELAPMLVTGRATVAGGAGQTQEAGPSAAETPPKPEYPDWIDKALEAPGMAALPTGANSHVEALMVARRDACDAALRGLAQQVLALPVRDGVDVRGSLRLEEGLGVRVEQAIRNSAAFVAPSEQRSNAYAVTARLELLAVAREIWGEGVTQPRGVETPERSAEVGETLAPEAVRQLAFEQAVANAREQLFEQVRRQLVAPSVTVDDQMRSSPAARAWVEASVNAAPIIHTAYPSAGECEVVASLDVAGLVRELRR